MERIDDNDRWRLSSGRELYSVLDTFGLNVLKNTIHSGYDHTFPEASDGYEVDLDGTEPPWTPEERAELADFMIEKWQAFKTDASTAVIEPVQYIVPKDACGESAMTSLTFTNRNGTRVKLTFDPIDVHHGDIIEVSDRFIRVNGVSYPLFLTILRP